MDNASNESTGAKTETIYIDTKAPVSQVIDGDAKDYVSPETGIDIHVHLTDAVSRVISGGNGHTADISNIHIYKESADTPGAGHFP